MCTPTLTQPNQPNCPSRQPAVVSVPRQLAWPTIVTLIVPTSLYCSPLFQTWRALHQPRPRRLESLQSSPIACPLTRCPTASNVSRCSFFMLLLSACCYRATLLQCCVRVLGINSPLAGCVLLRAAAARTREDKRGHFSSLEMSCRGGEWLCSQRLASGPIRLPSPPASLCSAARLPTGPRHPCPTHLDFRHIERLATCGEVGERDGVEGRWQWRRESFDLVTPVAQHPRRPRTHRSQTPPASAQWSCPRRPGCSAQQGNRAAIAVEQGKGRSVPPQPHAFVHRGGGGRSRPAGTPACGSISLGTNAPR